MPDHNCPYCGGNHFTNDYVEVVACSGARAGEGYNLCTGCDQWSKWKQQDEFQHELPPSTEPVPNRAQVE